MISNISTLKLEFEISTIDGNSMSMIVNNNGVLTTLENLQEGIFVYQDYLRFPSTFSISVAGKGPLDTQVDDQGNIIKDKYIKLNNIEVDGLNCDPYYLYQKIVLNSVDGQIVTSNYWGFNGVVNLNFSESNSFYWGLHCVK